MNAPFLRSGGRGPLHAGLIALYDEQYDVFHRIFARGLAVRGSELGDLSALLLEAGLISDAQDQQDDEQQLFRSAYRITRLGADLLVTDPPAYAGRDRVLYLSDNESLLLARSLPDCANRRVLDLGSGSGVQAIASWRLGARRVTSVDVSPRAVTFTRFNLALNGLPDDDVQLVGLDDFNPAEPYDLLINNPPFVPVPPATAFMTSGAGGVDGLDFVRKLIRRLPQLLRVDGTLCLVSLSPGTRHLSELEMLLLDHAAGLPLTVRSRSIFAAPVPILDSLAPFESRADIVEWGQLLAERGHTHLHNLLITMEPAARRGGFQREVLNPAVYLHPGNTGSIDWSGLFAEIRLSVEMAQ